MTPEDEQYITQLLAENAPAAGPLREVVQNILDEPVPQRVKERLSKPLLPGKNKPITPLGKKKEIKRRAMLKEFDPIQLIKNGEKSYEGMLVDLKEVWKRKVWKRKGVVTFSGEKDKDLKITSQNIL